MTQREGGNDSPPPGDDPAVAPETQDSPVAGAGPAEIDVGVGRPSVIVVGYSAKPEGRAALSRAVLAGKLASATIAVVHTSTAEEVAELTDVLDGSGLDYELRRATDEQDPAEELVKVADEWTNAMIVIGLRRRSPVGKLLLGSSAQRVLLDASCPVLAVKADVSAPSQNPDR